MVTFRKIENIGGIRPRRRLRQLIDNIKEDRGHREDKT